MNGYFFHSNFINKKNFLTFIRTLFPFLNLDLRSEQYVNIEILKIFRQILNLACEVTLFRNGNILQSKDVRFSLFVYKKINFSKPSFLIKKKKIPRLIK